MTIGLFLDVDNTLTMAPAQSFVAKHLKCEEEFQKIEDAFSRDEDSDQFGSDICELYARHNFTRSMAEELAKKIIESHLRPQARDVLKLQEKFPGKVVTYLVSSGPNYVVLALAEKFGIPEERVLCSKYDFAEGGSGKILRCSLAVSPPEKTSFVTNAAKKYGYTVGLGDHQKFDSFLQACSVGLYIKPVPAALYCPNLNVFTGFMKTLLSSYALNVATPIAPGLTIRDAWRTLIHSGPLVTIVLAIAGGIFLAGRLSTLLGRP